MKTKRSTIHSDLEKFLMKVVDNDNPVVLSRQQKNSDSYRRPFASLIFCEQAHKMMRSAHFSVLHLISESRCVLVI